MPTINKAFLSLDDTFKPLVTQILTALEAKGWQPMVWEGRRTIEQQQAKVDAGLSTTMNSYHLTGKAADIVDMRFKWNVVKTHNFWWDLGNIALEIGRNSPHVIRWGGIWGDGDDIDTPIEQTRWAIFNKARCTNDPKLVDAWFSDVAHIEMRS